MGKKSTLKYMIKETDWLLYLLCVAMSIFGAFMVYSATYNTLSGDSFLGGTVSRDFIATAAGSFIGIVIGIIVSFIDYDFVLRLTPLIGAGCLVMMLLLFTPLGWAPADRPDAKCWFDLGITKFQPSELVKIGFIITFSTHLEAVRDNISSFKNACLLTVHGMVPIVLVVLTGDVGSALVFIFIFVGLMFAAGLDLRYFAAAFVAGVIAVPLLWIKFLSQFQKNRLLAVYFPEALSETEYKTYIYQQARGLRAIGAGMLKGDGFLKGGLTQSNYVPVSESDMIFSVVSEELGFIGSVAVLLVLMIIIIKIFRVGADSRNQAGYFLCVGTGIMLASQAIINIGMCMSLLPCIGITLPFLSGGGSSNMCIYFGIGIVMSVYRFNCAREPENFRLAHLSTSYR